MIRQDSLDENEPSASQISGETTVGQKAGKNSDHESRSGSRRRRHSSTSPAYLSRSSVQTLPTLQENPASRDNSDLDDSTSETHWDKGKQKKLSSTWDYSFLDASYLAGFWGKGKNDGKNGSLQSVDTQFDVSRLSLGSVLDPNNQIDFDESFTSEVFEDPDPDLTEEDDIQELPTMPDSESIGENHLVQITHAQMIVDDDIAGIDFQATSDTVLEAILRNAISSKEDLQAAYSYFSRKEKALYTQEVSKQLSATKRELIRFIKAASEEQQQRIAARQQPVVPQPQPQQHQAGNGATTQIRVRRVTTHAPGFIQAAQALCNELEQLETEEVEMDNDFHRVFSMYEALKSRCASQEKNLVSLRKDAAETGMAQEAAQLDDILIAMQDKHEKLHSRLIRAKTDLGIYAGKSGTGRFLETAAPKFSGAVTGDMDFFKFMQEFEDYCASKSPSNLEMLRIMVGTCLEGPAKILCENKDNIDQVWEALRRNYGDPIALLKAKTSDIANISGCKDYSGPEKIRDWGCSIQSKMEYLSTLADKHGLKSELHHSAVVGEIIKQLTPLHRQRYNVEMAEIRMKSGRSMTRCELWENMEEFINTIIALESSNCDIDAVCKEAAPKPGQSQRPPVASSTDRNPKKRQGNQVSRKHAASQPRQQQNNTPVAVGSSRGTKTKPTKVNCQFCTGSHSHLYYCVVYIDAEIKDRYPMVAKCGVCRRCLRMDKTVDYSDKTGWFDNHADECYTNAVCFVKNCKTRPKYRQFHFSMCLWHRNENKQFLEPKFTASLDQAELPGSNVTFLFSMKFHKQLTPAVPTVTALYGKDGMERLPDISDSSIYMMQYVEPEKGKRLMVFYDSGCDDAGISDRAYSIMETETVRSGPTTLNVAGGRTFSIPGGDERFWLQLDGTKVKAAITGLHMEHITGLFPKYKLLDVWQEICDGYAAYGGQVGVLPQPPEEIGGYEVDIMIGIKYYAYFPDLVFSLPSGLSLFRARLAAPGGFQGIIGGPHKAWRQAEDAAVHIGYRKYITLTFAAYKAQKSSFEIFPRLQNPDCEAPKFIGEADMSEDLSEDKQSENSVICDYFHCQKHLSSEGWMVPSEWDLSSSSYRAASDPRCDPRIDELGTAAEYRCISCRNCPACRKGDFLESVSLKEEMEQHLIESSVRYNKEEKRLEAILPFIDDPTEGLKPNKVIARKVLESQMRKFSKKPEMITDTLKSHDKLKDKGHVAKISELSESERDMMNSTSYSGYFIPWRTVYKESSMSTPCRVVFDAGAKTPGGSSLNDLLAKGQNKLCKILDILVRFRRKQHGAAADISMCYNGVKLNPAHYCYQKYLWIDELKEGGPVEEWVIKTLIYGVRSSGGQTMAALQVLAEDAKVSKPENIAGAEVLSRDSYVDDIVTSVDSAEEAEKVAADVVTLLEGAQMSVKSFSFTGKTPSEKVSTDSKSIGLLGYTWECEQDFIKPDIKELFFGKASRGKLPEPITGDISAALKKTFTRRTLTGKVAGVYDPLGLLTPITSKLKMDLHDLVQRKLDWDDQVPLQLLPTWVENLETIQKLDDVRFRRTLIPEEAANTDIELIVAVDASENLAVCGVYSRVLLKNGSYDCQLICAKSKIITGATIPRAELKSAVIGTILGHVVKQNLGNQFKDVLYITDSAISLFWIQQDERPMKIPIRNSVIEIRRFSEPENWFHVISEDNPVDIATRPTTVELISLQSEWQTGKPWMKLPKELLPIKTTKELTLSGEEKRKAAEELKAPDFGGFHVNSLKKSVADRYEFSRYIVDPCARPWNVSVRSMAYVIKFCDLVKQGLNKFRVAKEKRSVWNKNMHLEEKFILKAKQYFFMKGTKEVIKFSKPAEYKHCTEMKDGVLYYTSRILEGQEINDVEKIFTDLHPLKFTVPVLDRYSPVAYSIMLYCHTGVTHHMGTVSTLRHSREMAFIFQGRDLAKEIRNSCVFCKRYVSKLASVELGKIHEARLTVAPAFFNAQVDLMGPFSAYCEHNHRSTVKVYGLVFKDPACAAVAVYVMDKYDTDAFVMSYNRFSSRFGHPQKLFIDEGSQLMKACKSMEFSVMNISQTLSAKFQVGIEFETCPVGGHNMHGSVERSIKEIKRLFMNVFRGIKLSILGYETAFSFVSSELNNLPLCLGSKYENLDRSDLITPARLLLGRNNKRAPAGCVVSGSLSKRMKEIEEVQRAWWQAWKNEKLLDFIPRTNKWQTTDYRPKQGDIVLFLRREGELVVGEPNWRIGRIKEVEIGVDGICRAVIIEYRNANEAVFRTTRRATRSVAVLHEEGDLELTEKLNEAARSADISFIKSKFSFQELSSDPICKD